jgi:uncharacterized protein (TIGR02145 family)
MEMNLRWLLMLMAGFVLFSCEKEEDENRMVDVEGNKYKTVQIGTQIWMAENLKVTKDRSGKSLVTYCYLDRDDFCEEFGRLYAWEVALEAAPQGWHIPSDEEWRQMERELGLSADEELSFGWRGTDHGLQLAEGGSSGFEALFGGYKDGTVFWSGRYFDLGYFAAFWTRSQVDSLRAVGYFIYNNEGSVVRDDYDKTAAFSIRCVKD